VKLLSSKRRIVAAAALLVLALFVLRPGASRLKSRIVSAISSGVGRSVDIGSVHIRLLPRPGFDLENLVVYDDPAFGAEPMLRASEVTASLRLTSLLRGRLEIARLELTYPSLNLVRLPGGRWNLEALLERTAHIPLAPTGKAKSEPRPGFPYIEATRARINFKSGPEKKPYALTNADFSLWQDSENSWGVRLKAQPVRTDLNLNDTGLLQVTGAWQRADALRDTPLQFKIEWNGAQLGQFTKFFTGNDQGWRGEILLDAALTGTPAKLRITSSGSIQDFRRYDITNGQALRLAAHCDGEYSSLNQAFHELLCTAPVGSGRIGLQGEMGLPGSHIYGLRLTAEEIPASAVAVLVERAKQNLPEDMVASGTLNGNVRIEENGGAAARLKVEGGGEFSEFRLASAANKAEIGPETVPFVVMAGGSAASGGARISAIRISAIHGSEIHSSTINKSAAGIRFPDGPHVEFGPFPVAIGRAAAATARGWVNRGGYCLWLSGDAEIAKALRVARMFGLPALQPATEGDAQVELQIAGSWAGRSQGTTSGFTGPQVTGTAKLRNVRIAVRGVGGPVEITSAEMQFLTDEVRVVKMNAKAADTLWTGSIELPRGCGTPAACQAHFALNANQITLGELSEWASPSPKERRWYQVLEPSAQAGAPFLESVRASGQLTTDRLQVQSLAATKVSAKVSLDGGKLQILELNADFLGGKHRGEWHADFGLKPALCSGSGNFVGLALAGLADAVKNAGITGSADASYEVKGPCPEEFWKSAEATLGFVMKDGSLPHFSLGEDAEPLEVTRFAGQARLHGGEIEMKDARLDSTGGTFEVSGTASLKGELDLKLARGPGNAAAAYTIGGTLAEPRVARAGAETQARLKP
jgi:uncharacterized protein involved in outer membrane biogenesis